MICLLLCSTAAAQYASEPQPVVFYDDASILPELQVDTGWFPTSDSPIAIRLFIDSLGGIETTLSGQSELSWTGRPGEPMLQRVMGEEDGAVVSLDALFDFGIDIRLDVPGAPQGLVELVDQQVEFVDLDTLDGMLLPGTPYDAHVESDIQPAAVSVSFEITPGVDLAVGIGLAPDLDADISGLNITTEALGEGHQQSLESQWVEVDPNPDGASEIGFVSWWSGLLVAKLDLILSPQVWVTTPAGNFNLARFDIPVPIVDAHEVRTSEPAFYAHPLPLFHTNAVAHDFGRVPLGQTAVFELPLVNEGDLVMVGGVEVLGSEDVAVFPDVLSAIPQGEDGVAVMFTPSELGAMTAEITIRTNDPAMPEWIVQVQGQGVPDDGSGIFRLGHDACQCSSGPSGAWWWPTLALILALRRRQPPRT